MRQESHENRWSRAAALALALACLVPLGFAEADPAVAEPVLVAEAAAGAEGAVVREIPVPETTRPQDDAFHANIVGAGRDRLTVELEFAQEPLGLEVERGGLGSFSVVVHTATPPRLPWHRKDLGSALVASLVLREHPDGIALQVAPGPDLADHGVTREGRVVRVDLLGAQAGAGPRSESSPFQASRPMRVVIDPGHGGDEDGAIGPSGLKEKDVVLDIARRLSALLSVEGFEVHLTRGGDETLSLDDRAGVANEKRADLFMSLHVNASTTTRARGAETFFLARDATDDESRTLAALENGAHGASRDDTAASHDLPLILWDLAQVEHLETSAQLAELIQDRLNEALGLRNRGVRQAPFRVLVGATCPAVLVETGFMSNPDEEKLLADPEYRRKLATTLARAIVDFRARGGLADLPREPEFGR